MIKQNSITIINELCNKKQKMATYRITIIIPSYKPGAYINKCLESIAEQTLNHNLFEVIIVLNGCNQPYYDNIQHILSSKLTDIHTTLLQIDEGGVSNARNRALDRAKGEYIAFIDDDDYLSACYLEALLKVSGKDAIAVSNVIQIDERSKQETPYYFLTAAYQQATKQRRLTLFNSRKFLSSAWCKLIPMAIIGKRRFCTNMQMGEDSFFMFLVSDKIKTITLSSPHAIYYRLLRTSSVAHRPYTLRQRLAIGGKLFRAYLRLAPYLGIRYNLWLYLSRIVATLQNIIA